MHCRENLKLGVQTAVPTQPGSIKVDERYSHMTSATSLNAKSGVADAAWDD